MSVWEFSCAIEGWARANGAGPARGEASPEDLERVARLADAMPATLKD